MADRGGGEENGERAGPVVMFVARVVGVVDWWWMGWVKMNWVATWGRGRRSCKGLGTGLDGERLRRRGVSWRILGGGPGGLYREGFFCFIIGGRGGKGL